MASNINPYNVDGTFPVAGQDNSSQGFRNNFTNIKNNLTFAYNEITDLQNKALLISPLNGQTLNNDLAGGAINRPKLVAWTSGILDLGAVSGAITLDFNSGNYQQITTAGAVALNFINIPYGTGVGSLGYGLIRVVINVQSLAHTVTLPTTLTVAGVNDIAGYNPATNAITFDTTGNYVFDISAFVNDVTGVPTYIITDVTRNKATFRDPNFYYNEAVSPTVFIGFENGLATALAADSGLDQVSVLGSVNSSSFGNLTLANVLYTQIDTGGLAGYSVTSARGNIQTGTVQPVHSGDFLGYVNSIAFSGNGTPVVGNVFQQLASINFFATGSNVTYGLGGNIAFFTADDGGTQINRVLQAVGIENDQSARFYGNVTVATNIEIGGTFKTDGTIVEGGTYVTSINTVGGSFVANANTSTLIVDSASSASIAWANITLPANPVNGQRIKIVSAAPIQNANVNAPSFAAVKWVPTTAFQNGNAAVNLTYISGYSTWYRS
jgi:hypothetical protein